MNEAYLTQCRHCHTRFRILSSQLAVADGRVRCGHCLETFNARARLRPLPESASLVTAGPAEDEIPPEAGSHDSDPLDIETTGEQVGKRPGEEAITASSRADHDRPEDASSPADDSLAEADLDTRLVAHRVDPITGNSEEPRSESGSGSTQRPWLHGLVFALLLLTVIPGAAYWGWLNFNTVYRYPVITEMYQGICELAHCELPIPEDISKIRSRHLLIRQNPLAENELLAEVTFLNTWEVTQPFPDIIIQFRDIQNREIAEYRVGPEVYLARLSADHQRMPPKQPFIVSVPVPDPGEKAVNYQLDFRSSRQKTDNP